MVQKIGLKEEVVQLNKKMNNCGHLGSRPYTREEGGRCLDCNSFCCVKCIDFCLDTSLLKKEIKVRDVDLYGICKPCKELGNGGSYDDCKNCGKKTSKIDEKKCFDCYEVLSIQHYCRSCYTSFTNVNEDETKHREHCCNDDEKFENEEPRVAPKIEKIEGMNKEMVNNCGHLACRPTSTEDGGICFDCKSFCCVGNKYKNRPSCINFGILDMSRLSSTYKDSNGNSTAMDLFGICVSCEEKEMGGGNSNECNECKHPSIKMYDVKCNWCEYTQEIHNYCRNCYVEFVVYPQDQVHTCGRFCEHLHLPPISARESSSFKKRLLKLKDCDIQGGVCENCEHLCCVECMVLNNDVVQKQINERYEGETDDETEDKKTKEEKGTSFKMPVIKLGGNKKTLADMRRAKNGNTIDRLLDMKYPTHQIGKCKTCINGLKLEQQKSRKRGYESRQLYSRYKGLTIDEIDTSKPTRFTYNKNSKTIEEAAFEQQLIEEKVNNSTLNISNVFDRESKVSFGGHEVDDEYSTIPY